MCAPVGQGPVGAPDRRAGRGPSGHRPRGVAPLSRPRPGRRGRCAPHGRATPSPPSRPRGPGGEAGRLRGPGHHLDAAGDRRLAGATRGVHPSSSWISVLLHRDGFRYQRPRGPLGHTADPACQRAAAARWAGLRQAAGCGRIDPFFLDESGCAATAPTGYTWVRTGVRALVARQDKRNRRVNVLGALACDGPEPHLVWTSAPAKIDAGTLLGFVCTRLAPLPGGADAVATPPPGWQRGRPCTVVLAMP